MKKQLTRIVSSTVFREAFLYGIIGVTSALLDFTAFVLLCSMRIDIYIANFIGMNVGMGNSFICNSRFNFKKTDNIVGRFIIFFTVGYCGICLSMAILWFGCHILSLDHTFTKLVSIIIIAVIQFLLNKYVTFSGNQSEVRRKEQAADIPKTLPSPRHVK